MLSIILVNEMRKTVIPLDLWGKIINWLEKYYDSADLINKGKTYIGENFISLDPSVDEIYKKVVKKFGIRNVEAKKELRNYFDYMGGIAENEMNASFNEGNDYTVYFSWEYYWKKWIMGDN